MAKKKQTDKELELEQKQRTELEHVQERLDDLEKRVQKLEQGS